jgi:hypothetical protein
MLAGFINTPEPIMLPMTMAVADQKPILLARDDVVDILERKIRKKCCGNKKAFLRLQKGS